MSEIEHGTVECYDEGCRRPVCVHAHTLRVAAVQHAGVQATVAEMLPPVDPPLVVEDESAA